MSSSTLRSLALAATPGPWSYLIDDYENGTMFLTNDPKHEQHPIARDLVTHDAAYIAAASPAVVLALLDCIDKADEAMGWQVRSSSMWPIEQSYLDARDRLAEVLNGR